MSSFSSFLIALIFLFAGVHVAIAGTINDNSRVSIPFPFAWGQEGNLVDFRDVASLNMQARIVEEALDRCQATGTCQKYTEVRFIYAPIYANKTNGSIVWPPENTQLIWATPWLAAEAAPSGGQTLLVLVSPVRVILDNQLSHSPLLFGGAPIEMASVSQKCLNQFLKETRRSHLGRTRPDEDEFSCMSNDYREAFEHLISQASGDLAPEGMYFRLAYDQAENRLSGFYSALYKELIEARNVNIDRDITDWKNIASEVTKSILSN